MNSTTSHKIKHRTEPNNEFYTPIGLVRELLLELPISDTDTLLDSAFGTGNFYNNFPVANVKSFSNDFFNYNIKHDWIITNPPYSDLDEWIRHTCLLSNKGFALLIGSQNVTPKRIELIEQLGFGISKIMLCKVFEWYGISAFVICERGKKSIVDYNRKVWYSDNNDLASKENKQFRLDKFS